MVQLIDVVPVKNILGEGVLWNVRTARLWWTDIQGKCLFCYDPAMRTIDRIWTPERVGSFAFVAGSRKLIAAFESGLAFFDPDTRSVEWLFRLERPPSPVVRFNDGRTDRQGRFWAGTMVEGDGPPLGRLHCLDRTGHVAVQPDPVHISNALCVSPDGTRLYFADSPQRKIFVYDLDPVSGALSNRRIFAETPEGAYPDGANVDRDGFVWNAQWGSSRVVRYAPDGSVDLVVEVPASQPSCVAFGGADLNLLFVTTARDGLKGDALLRQPSAGNLFVYKTDTKGLPEAEFIFDGGKQKSAGASAG